MTNETIAAQEQTSKPADGKSELNDGLESIIDDLVFVINTYEGKQPLLSCQGQGMDGYSALANFVAIAKKARDLHSNVKLRGCPTTEGETDK